MSMARSDAKRADELLDWLKARDRRRDLPHSDQCPLPAPKASMCPALDAIMFLHPRRKSQIDVVQSVGRVMRRAEGKKMGYVILPVGVPPGVTPEEALDDNETIPRRLADPQRAARPR